MGDGPNARRLSAKHINEQCAASLKRLNMDYVDIPADVVAVLDEMFPVPERLRAEAQSLVLGRSGGVLNGDF
jgi:aryl-alcohol dehydrogenase-like predicted oxidoreductase